MRTIGDWLKEKFLGAPSRGLVIADLFKEMRRGYLELDIIYKGGTYHSFNTYFAWFRQLGYVEATGETEPSRQRGGDVELVSPRVYYRITAVGEAASTNDWSNPMITVHPEYSPQNRKEYMRDYMRDRRKRRQVIAEVKGRPVVRRGRPRVAALAEQVPMFPEIVKPKPPARKVARAPRKPRELVKPRAPEFDEQIRSITIPMIKKIRTNPELLTKVRASLEGTLTRAKDIQKRAPDKTAMGAIVHKLSSAISDTALIETALGIKPAGPRQQRVLENALRVVQEDLME